MDIMDPSWAMVTSLDPQDRGQKEQKRPPYFFSPIGNDWPYRDFLTCV